MCVHSFPDSFLIFFSPLLSSAPHFFFFYFGQSGHGDCALKVICELQRPELNLVSWYIVEPCDEFCVKLCAHASWWQAGFICMWSMMKFKVREGFTGFQPMESEAFTQNFSLIMVVAHFANRALKFLPGSFIILENHQRSHTGWEMKILELSFGSGTLSAIQHQPNSHC